MNLFVEASSSFLQRLAQEVGIGYEDLARRWEQCLMETIGKRQRLSSDSLSSMIQATKGKPVIMSKKTKSAYQYFFSHQQTLQKQANPSISFGDLSKTISRLWKDMSKEQRQQWVADHVKEEDPLPSPGSHGDGSLRPIETALVTNSPYRDLSMKQLRELCRTRNVHPYGNRCDLLTALSAIETTTPSARPRTGGDGALDREALYSRRVTVVEPEAVVITGSQCQRRGVIETTSRSGDTLLVMDEEDYLFEDESQPSNEEEGLEEGTELLSDGEESSSDKLSVEDDEEEYEEEGDELI